MILRFASNMNCKAFETKQCDCKQCTMYQFRKKKQKRRLKGTVLQCSSFEILRCYLWQID